MLFHTLQDFNFKLSICLTDCNPVKFFFGKRKNVKICRSFVLDGQLDQECSLPAEAFRNGHQPCLCCISLGMLVLGTAGAGAAGTRNGEPGMGAELVRGAGCPRLPGLCCPRGDCSDDVCKAFSTLLCLLGFA